MATTQAELDLLIEEIGTQFKNVRALLGTLANLTTAEKSNLVAAISEVNAKTANAGAAIDDSVSRGTTVYSSSKTTTLIEERAATLRAELLGGAGPTIDTLKEIADLLAGSDLADDNAIQAVVDGLGKRVRFDAAQALTAAEKAQANANIGSVSLAQFGDPAHSYRDVFLAAIV